MKFILTTIFALFLIFNVSSQSWKYSTGGNSFDGVYRAASILGKGNRYPYTKPTLAINIFNEERLNFFITDAGYFHDDESIDVYFIFNKDRNQLFIGSDYSISKEGETIFFSGFINSDGSKIDNFNFIEKLKSSNTLEVRVSDDNATNDIAFSLSGSTIAINKVLTKEYLDKINALRQKLEENLAKIEELEEQQKEITKVQIQRISKILEKNNFELDEALTVANQIKHYSILREFKLEEVKILESKMVSNKTKYHIFIYDIDSTKINEFVYKTPKHLAFLVEENKQIETQKIKQDSIKIVEEIKKNLDDSTNRVSKLIEKYNFEDETKKSILKELETNYRKHAYNIKNIDSLNIIKPNKKGKIIMRMYDSSGEWLFSLNDVIYSDDFRKSLKKNKTY